MLADQAEAPGGEMLEDGRFVIACPRCRADEYDPFPGLRSPIGTWLIPPAWITRLDPSGRSLTLIESHPRAS